jgi:3-dehydroquinate dehydratase
MVHRRQYERYGKKTMQNIVEEMKTWRVNDGHLM